MLTADFVGKMRSSLKPAPATSVSYSSAVCSRPPGDVEHIEVEQFTDVQYAL
jgi:hypothetical protein